MTFTTCLKYSSPLKYHSILPACALEVCCRRIILGFTHLSPPLWTSLYVVEAMEGLVDLRRGGEADDGLSCSLSDV